MKKAVIGWGRLNPVTSGHELLINKVLSVAKRERAEPRMYLSHTQNAKKDPLQYRDKITMAKKAFGQVIKQSTSRTLIQLMQELQRNGFTDVVMVAGSDRLREYNTLLNKYNGKDYTFDSIKVVSAGQRDPDADGASGMSATKLRQAAMKGDEKLFAKGVPSKLSKADTTKLYKLVRKGMLIEELDNLIVENKDMLDITEDDITDIELQEIVDAYDYDEEYDQETVEEENLLERAPLTLQQRIKKARVMKRLAPKLKRMRAIKKFRMADAKKLQTRARKQAKMIFRKKMAGTKGANYNKLSPSEKINIDRLVATKSAAIEKLAKRLLPKVRKAEIARIRQARQAKNESVEILNQTTEEFLNKTYNDLFTEGALDQARAAVKREKDADKIKHDRALDRARMQDARAKVRTARAKNQGVSSRTSSKPATEEVITEKNKPNNPALWARAKAAAKSKFDVYPSAYANGWAVRWYKKRGGTWRTVKENIDEKGIRSLQIKAEKNNISFEEIKEIYDIGFSEWKPGSRSGQMYGFAKVNIHLANLKEKKLTPAELKKREEIAKALERENPNMPMDQKMAIATATAKKAVEGLDQWFGKGKKGDWVRVGTDGEIKGDCAREPGEGKPKCMPRSKAHTMSKKDRASAARRKRAADPDVDRPGTGNKPINVPTQKENFMDGKNPERKGLAKRSGVDTKASISKLRKVAKNSTGEKRRMAHWLANMKSGKKKK